MAIARWSLLMFGFGALLAAVDFLGAYLAQLSYGRENDRTTAYVVFLASAGLFVVGILLAWAAIR